MVRGSSRGYFGNKRQGGSCCNKRVDRFDSLYA